MKKLKKISFSTVLNIGISFSIVLDIVDAGLFFLFILLKESCPKAKINSPTQTAIEMPA